MLHRWGLGMDKKFHPTLSWECDYLSMLALKLRNFFPHFIGHVNAYLCGLCLILRLDANTLRNTVIAMSFMCSKTCLGALLTHWGRVTHICVGRLTIIDSDNGLSPGRRQAIIWTSAGILSIGPIGTNSSEIVIGIQTFSLKKWT